jgi:endonuclease YncB( thermonuclease family)
MRVDASMVIVRCLLLWSLWVVSPIAAADVAGKVVGIADGDTVTILDGLNRQHKVRLAGIDAPEKGQPFGQRSKQTLSECAFGRSVIVEGNKIDRYGRLVGKVQATGVDCNLRQVEQGLAWHYKQYVREQQSADRIAYDAAESLAKRDRLGLWLDPVPVPPWDFRRRKN